MSCFLIQKHSHIMLPMMSIEILLNDCCSIVSLFKNSLPKHGKIIKFQGDKQLLRNNILSYNCQKLKKTSERFLKSDITFSSQKSFLCSLRRKKYIHIYTSVLNNLTNILMKMSAVRNVKL